MYHRTPREYMEELERTYPKQITREGKRWRLCGISYDHGAACGLYKDEDNQYRSFKTRRKEKQ